jgi:hypothetical protein
LKITDACPYSMDYVQIYRKLLVNIAELMKAQLSGAIDAKRPVKVRGYFWGQYWKIPSPNDSLESRPHRWFCRLTLASKIPHP